MPKKKTTELSDVLVTSRRAGVVAADGESVTLHYAGGRSLAIPRGQTVTLKTDVAVRDLPDGVTLVAESLLNKSDAMTVDSVVEIPEEEGACVKLKVTNVGGSMAYVQKGRAYAKMFTQEG